MINSIREIWCTSVPWNFYFIKQNVFALRCWRNGNCNAVQQGNTHCALSFDSFRQRSYKWKNHNTQLLTHQVMCVFNIETCYRQKSLASLAQEVHVLIKIWLLKNWKHSCKNKPNEACVLQDSTQHHWAHWRTEKHRRSLTLMLGTLQAKNWKNKVNIGRMR